MSRLLIPRYDEITLFLMSLSFILIFCTDAEMKSGSRALLSGGKYDPRAYIAFGLFISGILFSLYHVFTQRQKTNWEKNAMLFFAVFVNGISGIAAGIHVFNNTKDILMLFPIWNIMNGGLLLLMYRVHIINESSIVDNNATTGQVILGSIVVVATLLISRFLLELYWATTFSICVSYATNINGTVQNIFPISKKRNTGHNQALPEARFIFPKVDK